MTRLLHISDLHAGTREEPEIESSLAALVESLAPELVVVSGDLTHRGRPEQHAGAAAFLKRLGRPLLVVPGNHDIPFLPPGRLTRPFAEFERHWQTAEPVYRSPTLHVVGLNSVRPWRHQSGSLSPGQLRRAAELLAEARAGALRVVVLHHHLVGAPWRSRKRPVGRRSRVLAALVEAGAELVLAGHAHQSALSERREFELASGGERAVTVSTAPGLGQPRPRRRGEARGLQLYEAAGSTLGAQTYVWSEGAFGLTAERLFPRGGKLLAG